MEDELDKLLNEKYTSVIRQGYGIFKGTVLPLGYKDFQQDIENFEVNDDDVFVSSFPKSGTTWTQEMVWLIINDLDYEGAKVGLEERFPFIEVGAMVDAKHCMEIRKDIVFPELLGDPIANIKKMKGRRCLKTHLPWNLLPLQIQNQTKKPKIIHVLRNPKDVCVSFHYHTHSVEACRGDLEDTFKLFLGGKLHYTPYWPNILSFWERRHLPNMLLITYEDMKKDLSSVIRKVAAFLDKEINDIEMEKLVKHLSFEEMRKNDAVNKEGVVELVKTFSGENSSSDVKFMRSGTVGNYKEKLTPDMIETLDRWIEENIAGTGLKFLI